MNLEDQWITTEARLAREADSMAEILETLRPRISPVLIGKREWQGVLDRAHALPATIAAFPFGFELPLHEPQPVADFGVSVFGESRTAAFFEDAARPAPADPSAAGIAGLLAEMKAGDSPLCRIAGRKIMLEYDIGSARIRIRGFLSPPAKGCSRAAALANGWRIWRWWPMRSPSLSAANPTPPGAGRPKRCIWRWNRV